MWINLFLQFSCSRVQLYIRAAMPHTRPLLTLWLNAKHATARSDFIRIKSILERIATVALRMRRQRYESQLDVTWRDVTSRDAMRRDITWRDATRCDLTCLEVTWRDLTWPDATRRDVKWRDATWRDASLRDATWSVSKWRAVTWPDATRRDVTWRDVTSRMTWC